MTITFQLDGQTKEIRHDGVCFIPYDVYMGKDKNGKDKIQETALGYFNNLGRAVNKVIESHLGNKDETITLMQYVTRYELAVKEVKEMISEVEF